MAMTEDVLHLAEAMIASDREPRFVLNTIAALYGTVGRDALLRLLEGQEQDR